MMRSCLLAVACITAFASPALAQQKRVITHEDLWLLPRVGAPVVSPDGKLAVFVVTEPAYKADEQSADLWIVPTDGSAAPRRLTSSKSPESGATWSTDGKRIAFAARRDGDDANQIYVLDIAGGGEAQRVTTISTGARLPKFSPDGTRIAFTTEVPPGSKNDADSKRLVEEEKSRKYNVRTYTSFPIRNWDKWLPERDVRVIVQTIGQNDARDLLADSQLVKEPGFAARTTQGGSELDVVWTPDGQSIVFSATRNANRSAFDFTNTELWQVSASGGEPRRLTGKDSPEGGDSWAEPRFSPDGKTLYAFLEPRTARVYNSTRIGVLDWPSAKPRTPIVPIGVREAISFAIAANNRDVYLLAEDAGLIKLYRGSHQGGEAKLAFDLPAGMYNNLSSADRSGQPVLLANFESAVNPPEIARIDLQKGTHRLLSRFAVDKAAALDLSPVEHFWFDSKASPGRKIHNMIVRPANFDPSKKYPLLVVIHGGPHTMSRDSLSLRWNYHLLAAPGYVVLTTNYTGSTGFGEAFAQGIQGDPFKGPADEINQAADEAIARYSFIDGSRQCASGASYGGHLANWLQGTTTRYRCLISHAGLVNLEAQWGTSDVAYSREANMGSPPWLKPEVWSEHNPIRYAPHWRTPVLVTIGERDFRVPLNNSLEYWTALQRQQIESRLVVFPDENHWILSGENSRQFYKEVAQWLERWLQAP